MDSNDVIARVQQGEEVHCEECGATLALVAEQTNPIEVRCPNGHRRYWILWDPASPPSDSTADQKSVWLEPVRNLTGQQLKTLREIAGSGGMNLVAMKVEYSDGRRHLLKNDIDPQIALAISRELASAGLPSTIEEVWQPT